MASSASLSLNFQEASNVALFDQAFVNALLQDPVRALRDAGIDTYDEPQVAVTNIVCSYDMGRYINLNKVVITLNLENIEYEPEQFPGLIYRGDNGTALIFSSGKVILAGFKDPGTMAEFASGLKEKIAGVV